MKIIVKNLQQKIFELDLPETSTVGEVKAALESTYSIGATPLQKLILKGKVLTDNEVVQSLGLAPTDFFVVMVSKAKPEPPKPQPQETKPAEPVQTAPAPTPAPVQSTPAPTTTAPVAASQPAQPVSTDSASALVTGSALEQTIAQLMEMGFGREEVTRALRAAFNNPDRAVEYLFNGIPAHLASQAAQPAAQPAAQQPAAQPAQAAQPAVQQPAAQQPLFQEPAQQQQSTTGSPLDALRALPELSQLRAMVRSNPQLLQPMLQQLHRANPQLVQYIQQNPEEFFQLLQEDDEGGALPPNVIQVTPEEKEAIERLEALGFERSRVIEAFFACDKNEALAANYLFDSMNEED